MLPCKWIFYYIRQFINIFNSGISDLRQALTERAQTTLRHVVGARAVQSVVTEREAIAFEIAEIVGDVADVSELLPASKII